MGQIGRQQNTISFRRNERTLGPVSNTVILLVLAALLGLLYLTQVTKTNAYGYKISSLQKQQAALKAEHDNLELASANWQSLHRVQQSQAAQNLSPVSPSGSVQ